MKLFTTLLATALASAAMAQTTIPNGNFESWGGNPSPGIAAEPTGWYSNKSGSAIARLGPTTCTQGTPPHAGTYAVKVETEDYIGTKVNGVVTTGVVNAPSTDKTKGYIGTINYSTASDDRRTPFTGRPDSLIGWYKYTAGAGTEQGKVRAILHIGDYNDPEIPVGGNHPDLSANKIGDALFLTPMSSVSTWTRFSVPFSYVSAATPAYIMINITSSADQNTTVGGSILMIDDLEFVYAAPCSTVSALTASAITGTGATISWTAVTGSAGYVYAVDNSVTPPASGTFTTATSVPLTGLTAGTSYYAHVYDSCGVGSASGWVTIPFSTTSASGCNAETGLAANSITPTSATILWTPAAGAIGAEYVTNTIPTDPTGSGTGTTASTYNATGLSPATMYYAHVRDSCGPASLSAWQTLIFTTLSLGVNNVAAGGFAIAAFPNPAKDVITIATTGTSGSTGQVQLMDISGKLISTTAAAASSVNVNVGGLAAGIYLIRYTDSEHTQTIKINKQ